MHKYQTSLGKSRIAKLQTVQRTFSLKSIIHLHTANFQLSIVVIETETFF